MNHFSSRGNVLAAILTAFLMIMAILLAQSCQKEDGNHKPIPTPEEIERGYTDLEDLRNKLSGEWVANINQEDPYDVVLIQYNFFGEEDSKFIMFSANDILEPESGYRLDTVSIKWNLVEDYQGYSKAGVKGNAIEVLAPNDSTNYMVVKKIMQDSLYCTTAMGEYSATIGFSKIKEPVNVSALRFPSEIETESSESKTKADGSYSLNNWMSKIPDDTPLCNMCIPGSHDAATYNVDDILQFAATSQNRTLGNQFNAGSRVFDLRIRANKNGDYVGLYHNFVDCNMSLKEALEILVEKVRENPTEGVIVILKPEGNDFAESRGVLSGVASWFLDLVAGCNLNFSESILDATRTEKLATKIVKETIPESMLLACYDHPFHEEFVMYNIRRKIVVFCRPYYYDWGNGSTPDDEYFVAIRPFDENGKMRFKSLDDSRHQSDIYVQDNYGPSDNNSSGWARTKKEDFKKALELSASENKDGSKWFINSASGYYADITPKFPNYASSAADLYPEFMSAMRNGKYRGIFLQDYAGDDSYKRIPAAGVMALAVPSLAIPPIPIPFTDKTMRQVALELELKAAKALAPETKVKGIDMTRAVIDNNFKSWQYTVSVKTEGPGKVLIDNQEISEKTVDKGTVVYLYAIPDEGYKLVDWDGDGIYSGPVNPNRIRVERDQSVTAYFETLTPNYVYVKVDENSIGRGRVLINGEEVSEMHFAEDQEVEIYAEAFDGYTFAGWKEGGNLYNYYENPRSVSGGTYTASFGLKSSEGTLLSSEIQVSEDGRKVRFTKGNLYHSGRGINPGEENSGYYFYDLQYIRPELSSKRLAYFYPASVSDPEDWAYDNNHAWEPHVDGELFTEKLFEYNGKWLRTLTYEEWQYILSDEHSTFKSSNPVSFNRKLVNGNYSLVLFPANWTDEDLFYAPSVEGKVWEDMEKKGAVCLVLNGRKEYDVIEGEPKYSDGHWYNSSYYLAPCSGRDLPGMYVVIGHSNFITYDWGTYKIGACVRLVYDVD